MGNGPRPSLLTFTNYQGCLLCSSLEVFTITPLMCFTYGRSNISGASRKKDCPFSANHKSLYGLKKMFNRSKICPRYNCPGLFVGIDNIFMPKSCRIVEYFTIIWAYASLVNTQQQMGLVLVRCLLTCKCVRVGQWNQPSYLNTTKSLCLPKIRRYYLFSP